MDYRIRQASVADAPIIATHRVSMFLEMGDLSDDLAPRVREATVDRLKKDLASGDYVAWLVEADGEVVAGAGILFHVYYPTALDPEGRPTAHLVNVYTDPAHRRRGLAGRLVEHILQWCRANGLRRASLHASRAGRSLYEQLGFAETNEMRRSID